MSRYIDADALIEEFAWCKVQSAECNRNEWDEIITRVSKQPTVDAVPVVRCRDCRFFKPWDDGNYGKCKTGLSVLADMFCWCGIRADGERKEQIDG